MMVQAADGADMAMDIPDRKDHADDDQHDMELVEIDLEAFPMLTGLHAGVSQ